MSIEKSYFLKDPNSKSYKPTIVPPGRYRCQHYPQCKGEQIVHLDVRGVDGAPSGGVLHPCPLCGSLVMFRW